MKRADNEAKTESSDLISDVRDAENDVVFARHLIARLHMRKCIQNLRNRMSGILLFSPSETSLVFAPRTCKWCQSHWHLHAGNGRDQRQSMQMRYDSSTWRSISFESDWSAWPARLESLRENLITALLPFQKFDIGPPLLTLYNFGVVARRPCGVIAFHRNWTDRYAIAWTPNANYWNSQRVSLANNNLLQK